jgi:hypothetical protein
MGHSQIFKKYFWGDFAQSCQSLAENRPLRAASARREFQRSSDILKPKKGLLRASRARQPFLFR